MARSLIAALILLSGCAGAGHQVAHQGTPLASEVEATEARFMARTHEVGVVPGFRDFVTDDAIMFLPDPVLIKPMLATASWPGRIEWKPAFIAMSSDATMAISIGPSLWTTSKADPGYFLTIWRRQPDGSLRFVLDRGTDMPRDLYAERLGNVEVLQAAPSRDDRSDIGAAEERLSAAASISGQEALSKWMHPRGRVLRNGHEPQPYADATSFRGEAGSVVYTKLATMTAGSGDFGYAYGKADWTERGQQVTGYWTRVWQSTPDGWKVVVDHMQPRD